MMAGTSSSVLIGRASECADELQKPTKFNREAALQVVAYKTCNNNNNNRRNGSF